MKPALIWKMFLLFALASALCAPAAGASPELEEDYDAPGKQEEAAAEPPASAAAQASSHEVHVALFLHTNTYRAHTGSVTLSAKDGLMVSSGGAAWFSAGGGERIRFSLDGYRVLVAETSDDKAAEALMLEVKRASQPVSVFERTAGGQPLFSVEAGPYTTRETADAARLQLTAAPGIAARTGKSALSLRGPLYARAGVYESLAQAQAAAAPLWNAGIYAVPAVTSEGGAVRYELWIGGAADNAALEQAIAAAGSAVSGLKAAPLAADGLPYAVVRTDRTGASGLADGVRHAAIGGGVRLAAVSPSAPVLVEERYGRSYRGAIDVFAHQGALAVINRVDLEDYVASVVGSELDETWPAEALKAQAVAARTYVLKQGWKYGVAHVADTTVDQAYRGTERAFPAAVEAARSTAGETLRLPDGTLLDAFYHSNAGGRTADPAEVWGSPIPGIGSAESPDEAAEKGKLPWYRAVLPDGRIGYIRSDLVELTGTVNEAGFAVGAVSGDGVNVRPAPYVNNETNAAFAQLEKGTLVTVIGKEPESTAYRWIRGPYTSQQVRLMMQSSGVSGAAAAASGPVRSIEVSSRGEASGRVTGLKVDGKELALARPDQYRTLFGLPSGLFDVEETARTTVLGAGGRTHETPGPPGEEPLAAVGAGGRTGRLSSGSYLIVNGAGEVRAATAEPGFRFIGRGFGHGLGMSQWGVYGLAELGYDYRKILRYYYQDASIVKE